MKSRLPLLVLAGTLSLAACGPSPEQIASMTAAAATHTPVPTNTPAPTPTPMPEMSIAVADADGNPIEGAVVAVTGYGLGGGKSLTTGADGKVSLEGLTDASGSLSASAPGYKPQEDTPEVIPGPNDVTLTLERDPAGMLVSEACGAGEKLLYMEDFQDGDAQGWNEISFLTQGWSIGPDAAAPENTIVMAQRPADAGGLFSIKQIDQPFDNAVWRLRYRIEGQGAISLNWRFSGNFDLDGQHIDDSRYQIVLDTSGARSDFRRLQQPATNISAARGRSIKAGEWHLIEIATFDGATEVWIDGAPWAKYTDPKPIPAGSISLEVFGDVSPDTIYSFDNMSVCELGAAFAPMPTPEPAAQ